MAQFEPIPEETERLASAVVEAALAVHRTLGPGLLESVYEACLCRELNLRDVPFQSQVVVPIDYKGLRIDAALRLDLLVGGAVIVELKAVEQMLPLFEAQLLTYLKLTRCRLGLLINFNVPVIRFGIKRMVR